MVEKPELNITYRQLTIPRAPLHSMSFLYYAPKCQGECNLLFDGNKGYIGKHYRISL